MDRRELHRGERVQNVEVTEVSAEPTPLIPMSRTSHQPENPRLDIRGYLIYGSDGVVMGRVEEILLEADRRTKDRGMPLYHLAYAVVGYVAGAGTRQWLLVPIALVKETDPEERKAIIREPAKQACQEPYLFRAPDDLAPEGEQEVYAVWEVLSRWERSGRGPRALVEKRR
jgi:hypothetical protein